MKTQYDDSNRPTKGTKFKVVRFEEGSSLNDAANKLVGRTGAVVAYSEKIGVYATFEGLEGSSLIPYEQCQWD